nr:DUF2325 domain-containing protein [Nitrospirota bacterium]
MRALVVGGDHVEVIKKAMAARGVRRIEHWDGRKAGHSRRTIPKDTAVVVIFWDNVSHELARNVRRLAWHLGLPVVYCRRALGPIRQTLETLNENGVLRLKG